MHIDCILMKGGCAMLDNFGDVQLDDGVRFVAVILLRIGAET